MPKRRFQKISVLCEFISIETYNWSTGRLRVILPATLSPYFKYPTRERFVRNFGVFQSSSCKSYPLLFYSSIQNKSYNEEAALSGGMSNSEQEADEASSVVVVELEVVNALRSRNGSPDRWDVLSCRLGNHNL